MRAWTVTLAVAAIGLGIAAAPAIAVPGNFWGVVPQATPTLEQFERLKRDGVDSVRIPVSWGVVQPTPGSPIDFSGTDPVIADAAAAGVDVLPFLFWAPSWVLPHAPVPGTGGAAQAPRFLPVRNAGQRSGWRQFVIQAVRRYGPQGTFWAENPGLPRRPIRVWQIWNEANFKYFVTRPNPAEYGKLVKFSYAAVKAADRGARIVLGGLFSRPAESLIRRGPKQAYFASEFLDLMYKRTPGIKTKFHGVSLHPYTANFKRLVPYTEEVRRVLRAHRDAGKGLWVTELGWSSQRPNRRNSFAKGLSGQAAQLRGAFRLLRNRQPAWRVQRVYWFSVDDQEGSCNFCDGSGLFRDGFIPKPAWRAFVGFAGGRAG
ncbi:MAG: glycosyl hydrolase [Solirubrobacterales bacterium]